MVYSLLCLSKRAVLIASLVVCLGLPAAAQTSVLTGRLGVLWGDRPAAAASESPAPRFHLTTDDRREVRLRIEEELGASRFNNRRVTVSGAWIGDDFKVATIELAADGTSEDVTTAVSGPQPWVTVMCKFQDVLTEQKPLSYFEGMYDSLFPGFDHHWKEQSYGQIDVTGSGASGWHTLPHPRSYYVTDSDGDGNADYVALQTLRDDCLAASNISFAQYVGINMMFNANLDCCAWGGSSDLYLGGIYRSWRLTWNPPWAFSDIAVIGHEMGHGFGLPHSMDKWSNAYANRWDVMSDTKTDCARLSHGVYGCLPQHTIAYHKDLLGWIAPEKKYTLAGGETTINLERLAMPLVGNYLLAKIPIDATRFYTVEARQQFGYDLRVPADGVVIHHVDPARYEPAYIIDSDGNGDGAWLVGETFNDELNGIAVRVESASPNGAGYTVKLTKVTPTTTTVTASLTNGLPTTQVTFTATVSQGATGNVTFRDGDVDTTTVALSNGTAVWTTTLPHGLHTISAVYNGSATHGQSTSNSVTYGVGNTQLSINDVSVSEGNSGTTNAVFTVTAVQPEGQPAINYRVIDGSGIGTRLGVKSEAIAIPPDAASFPSTIDLAGSNGVISKVTVTLNRIEHTNPGDIDVLLVGPNGTGVVLMSDVGGLGDVFNVVLTFDDAAQASLNPLNLFPGTFKPTDFNDGVADSYGSPVPYGALATTLSAFNGVSPNGAWNLYIVDDTTGDTGTLAGGWSLNVETTGSDYDEVVGTLVMPQGATTATITVPVKGDTKAEADETFAVIITSTNAYVADGTGAGTIVNDDGPMIGAPSNVVASAIASTQVAVSWSTVAQATSYRVYRSSNGTAYAEVGTSVSTSLTDTSASANTAYLYKVHALNGSSESADSNVDLATTVVFTDSTLTSFTPVRLAHFTELMTAVNAVRTLGGLSAVAFASPAPAAGATVRRQHLVDLRTALNAARTALALAPVTFADSDVAEGVTPIRAAHVTDLRDGVR